MGRGTRACPWYLDVETAPWSAYHSATHVTVDLETTNKDHGSALHPDNHLVTAAVQVDGGPVAVGLESLDRLRELAEYAEKYPVVLVAHNAKFELQWLDRIGLDTTNFLVWDTMLAEYVLAGNRKWKLDLDSVAGRYGLPQKGRFIDALMKGGVCPSEMPEHLLAERVRGDVAVTTTLFYAQRERLEEEGLTRVMFTRCIVTPVLARMEANGMTLDPTRVIPEYQKALRERAVLEERLNAMAEGRKLRGPQLADLVYNVLGFEELTDRRGDPIRTASGQPKTDADTLDTLVAKTPEQKAFKKLRAEYGSVDAALTKNLEFFYGVCLNQDGHAQAQYNQAVTRTHRLSSSGKRIKFPEFTKPKSVQFQNLPRTMKPLFCARAPDRLIVESDGAQLEFRWAGTMAQDPQVLYDVTHGEDIHRFTASVLNRIPESAVTPKQRTAAKEHTFKPLYGGQSGTKRQVEYYEAFRAKYSKVYAMQQGWTQTVLKDKVLVTPTGLKFYWPDTTMTSSGYITNTPSIFNYPVQSGATADCIPVSMVYLYWEIQAQGLDALLVNTVHDSVIADVAKKDLDKYKATVVSCFLDKTYDYFDVVFGIEMYVPLGVGIKAGTHWGEGNEETVSYARAA